MIDCGAPQISHAQAEFEEAAKRWQEHAAHATAQAERYRYLAQTMRALYEDAIRRSAELGD